MFEQESLAEYNPFMKTHPELTFVTQTSSVFDCLAEIQRTASCYRWETQLRQLDALSFLKTIDEIDRFKFETECRPVLREMFEELGPGFTSVIFAWRLARYKRGGSIIVDEQIKRD